MHTLAQPLTAVIAAGAKLDAIYYQAPQSQGILAICESNRYLSSMRRTNNNQPSSISSPTGH